MDKDSKFIEVHSLKLLKELAQNRCMGLLSQIRLGNEMINGMRSPVYMFKIKPDVIEIKQKFEDTYGRDSVNLDDPTEWLGYDDNNIKSAKTYNMNKLTTTNYHCVSKLFDEGYANSLISIGKNKFGKRLFIFVNKSEIKDIIDQCADIARKEFEERNKGDKE